MGRRENWRSWTSDGTYAGAADAKEAALGREQYQLSMEGSQDMRKRKARLHAREMPLLLRASRALQQVLAKKLSRI
jgi:hypothetical protein